MKLAVCPGSFDPITLGHLDVIRRASGLFDRVIVLVDENPDKHPAFTPKERKSQIERVTAQFGNVTADIFCGFVTDYARHVGATAIVKGLRNERDFSYELEMAVYNRALCPEVESVFLMTDLKHSMLSSSAVKQLARYGGDISAYVPEELCDEIRKRLSMGKERQI